MATAAGGEAPGTRVRVEAPSLGEVLRGTRLWEALESAGGMGALAVRTVRIAARPPFGWVRSATVEASIGIRRALIPLAISHAAYLIGFGIILFGLILTNLGVVEREAGAMFTIWAREIATWITAMIFAGIVGSAVTADLGARRIREELDALAVLGVDQVRSLVVPRVMATTLIAPVLALISLLMVVVINYVVAPAHLVYTHGVFQDNLAQSIFPADLIAPMVIKNTVIGFFVGVVACHKGLTCKLGAEGVGRAVNQTVVITFFGIWMFNSFFNLAYLSLFPNAAVFHG
jgi:phospholipid/cholesterol/gamma-HCH transport system permease protein